MGGQPATTVPPAFQALGTTVGGSTSINVAWPTHQAGDIGILLVGTRNEPVATPSGWNAVANGSQGNGTPGMVGSGLATDGTGLQVFWRRAVSSSEAAAAVLDGGSRQQGLILTVRGCVASGNPVDNSAGDTATTSLAISVPGATTATPNCLVVAASMSAVGLTVTGGANASLSSFAVRANDTSNFSLWAATGIKAAAGAYAATTASRNVTALNQARVSLALKPA